MRFLSLPYVRAKWGNAGFQKYFRNTGWMFFSTIISKIISFFATIYVVRGLGPVNYGQLTYALSFVSIFSFIAGLGIDNILYRELISNPSRKKEYLGSAIVLRIVASAVTMLLVIWIGLNLGRDDVSKTLIVILSGTFILSSFGVISYEFQARVKSIYVSVIAVIINLILSTLKVLVVVQHKGVIYIAFVFLLEPILYAIFYWYVYEKKLEGRVFDLVFDKQVALALLRDSWPLLFTSAFALVYARIDQVLIKNMIGATAVGVYGAAVTVAEAWYFLPVIIIASLFPAIVNAKKTSEESYYGRLFKLAAFLLALAVSVSIVVMFAAPLAMRIIYGPAFLSGAIILKIYVWACTGTFLIFLANNYLVAENNKAGLIFLTFMPMVINVGLNLWWIPRYGIVGSAYATLISYTLAPFTLFAFKEFRYKFKKYFFRVFLAVNPQ